MLLQNPKICSQPFCNAEYKEKLSEAYHWILWSVLPLITKEDTIWVEHWDNLEDKVLSEATSNIVRRYKKVDQTLQNRQAWSKTAISIRTVIAKLDLDYKRGRGLSRMDPGHDEHHFHLFKEFQQTVRIVHLSATWLENNSFNLALLGTWFFQVYLVWEIILSSVLCLGNNCFKCTGCFF